MKDEKPDFEKIAAQLARPSGEEGIEVGNRMNQSNEQITLDTIDLLDLADGDEILELGPGNAKFAEYAIQKAPNIKYVGADISEVMIDEAHKINSAFCKDGSASFYLIKGDELPFSDECFEKIFTVNTLYFWKNPLKQLEELHRVLKPSGVLCIAIRSKDFMETLPFTKFGFTLYSPEEGMELFKQSAFVEITYSIVSTNGETFTGEPVVKEDVFFVLRK